MAEWDSQAQPCHSTTSTHISVTHGHNTEEFSHRTNLNLEEAPYKHPSLKSCCFRSVCLK